MHPGLHPVDAPLGVDAEIAEALTGEAERVVEVRAIRRGVVRIGAAEVDLEWNRDRERSYQ